MDSGVKLAPTFRMFRDGKQADEYVGSNPHELEVSFFRVAKVRCEGAGGGARSGR